MKRVVTITDELLYALVRKANPIPDEDRIATEAGACDEKAEGLLQQILASDRTEARAASQGALRRRRVLLTAVPTGAVALAAVVIVFVLSAGNDPSVAFAGWSASPTAAASGQVPSAESECRRNSSLGSSTPNVADTRGPYTLLLYGQASGGVCITGPSLRSPTGAPPLAPFHAASLGKSVAADELERIDNGALVGAAQAGSTLSFNDGRIGEAVTGVTLVLTDGSHVAATVANGWFAAWWPGAQQAQAAEIMTATGTRIQQLIPPAGYESSAPALNAR